MCKLFETDDASLRLAVGFALGSCVNFFPTFGLGLPLAIVLAFVTRTSVIGSIIGENLFKVFYPVFLYSSFLSGSYLYPLPCQVLTIDSILSVSMSWDRFVPFARAILVGAVVNTLVVGGLMVLVVYLLASRYRKHILAWLRKREEESY